MLRVGNGVGPATYVGLPSAINHADDVAIMGPMGYVANGRDGLRKLDLSDLDQPVLVPKLPGALGFNALGVAVASTPDGIVVGAADNLFFNHVPLFTENVVNTTIVDFSSFSDANGSGIALGSSLGVVSLGGFGIQVFRYRPLEDNEGIAPSVSITSPIDTVFPGQSIRALAVDDVGVSHVEFYIDDMLVGYR